MPLTPMLRGALSRHHDCGYDHDYNYDQDPEFHPIIHGNPPCQMCAQPRVATDNRNSSTTQRSISHSSASDTRCGEGHTFHNKDFHGLTSMNRCHLPGTLWNLRTDPPVRGVAKRIDLGYQWGAMKKVAHSRMRSASYPLVDNPPKGSGPVF